MMPITPRSLPRQQQREQRADAGRRQRRQDRERVDVALVQHAQHDVDADDRRQDQPQLVGQRRLEGAGRAEEASSSRWPACRSLARPRGSHRPPRRATTPGAVSKPIVVAGNCATCVICSGAGRSMMRGDRPTAASTCRTPSATAEWPSACGVGQQVRLRFQDHAVLVGLGEDGRDDALAERAVERVVDRRRGDAQPRRRVAIDRRRSAARPWRRQSETTLRSCGTSWSCCDQLAAPIRSTVGAARAFEREAVCVGPGFGVDRQILRRLQIERQRRRRRAPRCLQAAP